MATDVMPTSHRESAAADQAPGRTRWIIVSVLVLGWLAGVVWRLWLGHPVTHPIAHSDEDSYMNAARAIAGGPGGFSSETPLFRRIGYPLLVSPAFMFGLDFATSYKIVQVINAAVSALTLPVAYLLARRMFGLRTWIALAAAFVAATMPAGVFWSLVGMTDSIMAPILLGWFLAIHWWLSEPGRKGAAIASGVMTGVLYMVHIRGTILALVFFAFLALLLFRRRTTWSMAFVAAAPLVLLAVLNQVLIMIVGSKVHLRGDIVGGGTLSVFTSGQRLQVFAASFGTNIWYMCVVSAGLAGLAWAASTVEMFRPARDVAYRWTAGVALFSMIGTALGAAVILAGLVNTNADALYSRYVQVFVPFYVLFGFAVLVDTKLRTALKYAIVPVLILVVGGAVIAYRLRYTAERGHHLSYGPFGGPDIMTITAGWSKLRPYVGALIGLGGLAVLLAATRVRRLAIPLLALIVVANGVTMSVMREHVIEPLGKRFTLSVDLAAIGVGPGDKVYFGRNMTNNAYYVLYHDVYWSEIKLLKQDTPPADADVMIGRYYPSRADINFDGTKYGFKLLRAYREDQISVWRRQ
jgi:4-amino-4-deoxy-L-arabinose transferase-like glycosyltransferase